jgi:hypothetical protein
MVVLPAMLAPFVDSALLDYLSWRLCSNLKALPRAWHPDMAAYVSVGFRGFIVSGCLGRYIHGTG